MDHQPRTTLKQVAELAGVSSATASQVLNGRDNWASPETRERILSAARELAYRPSLVAKSLRLGQTYTVGLIMTVLSERGRTFGFDSAAAGDGYMAVMAFNPNDPAMEDKLIQRLLDRGVDGIAIYPTERGEHRQLRRLVARGFPIVTFDGAALLDLDCDDVSPNYRRVGGLQAAHALAVGKRRVLIVEPQPAAGINVLRDAGIVDELARQGAPPPTVFEFERPGDCQMPDVADMYGPMREHLGRTLGRFDAIIGYDSVACVACRVLHECGLRVPEEVAVIGAGNSALSSYGMLPITSIATNDERIGQLAYELLRRRIDASGRALAARRLTVESTLIARQSTLGNG